MHWICCNDAGEAYKALKSVGADIVDDIDDKQWGIRQFTVLHLDGNVFHFHYSSQRIESITAFYAHPLDSGVVTLILPDSRLKNDTA